MADREKMEREEVSMKYMKWSGENTRIKDFA